MEEVKAKIRQRRAQMLVHSRLYYVLDCNVVDDHTWQRWADELRDLQNKHPKACKIDFFDKQFKNWDGSSGFYLPLHDPWVVYKTEQLYMEFI